MTPPTIGGLRHEICLEQQVRTPTSGGGANLSWGNLGPMWADIRPLSGRETVIAGQIVSQVSHEIWIRHRAGTTATMRFRQHARVYDILAVILAGSRGQWMRCLCREKTAS
jgi:SPP1 family predicted phage head-tail adaptor